MQSKLNSLFRTTLVLLIATLTSGIMGTAKNRYDLRIQVDAHPDRSVGDTGLVPAVVTVMHSSGHREDRRNRTQDQALPFGLHCARCRHCHATSSKHRIDDRRSSHGVRRSCWRHQGRGRPAEGESAEREQ